MIYMIVVKQHLSLFDRGELEPPRIEHGGDIRLGRRKLARPIDTRRPLHLVLRSSRARGAWSLRRPENEAIVRQTLRSMARRYGIRVYESANSGNHLHFLVRTKCRHALQNFMRAFAGIVARLITGAQKGRAVGRFWDAICYSRVVQWGREFWRVRAYVVQNELETLKQIPRQPRQHRSRTRHRRQLE
jgi:REP element-mobilizing transposase RayT